VIAVVLLKKMLTRRDALKAAEQYAYDWGIDLPAHSSIKCAARWLLMPTEYRIEYAADTFSAIAYCDRRNAKPTAFLFRPTRDDILMLPPWAAFPYYSAFTIGWRMGDGEWYLRDWVQWYDRLPDEKKLDYQHRFPAPNDDRAWQLQFWDGFDND
jgi:hypothetical protein